MLKILLFIFISLLLEGCFLSFTPKEKRETIFQDYAYDKFDGDRRKLIYLAKSRLGTPYRYGGMDERGFDCSGFVCYVYKNAIGKKLPRSSKEQSKYVEILDTSKLTEGDILFFDTSEKGEINHCGIYLGGGKFIHSSSGKVYGVTISDFTKGFYKKAFRFGGRVIR